MDFDNNENMTRKMFLKRAAGAALGCACFSWGCSKHQSEQGGALVEKPVEVEKGKVFLAAACGTYCGACPAYINKHGEAKKRAASGPTRDPIDRFVAMMENLRCDGCLSGGELAAHCKTCNIRLCATGKQSDSRCTDCKEAPCYRITNLINQGGYPHRQEYLPNLEKMRQMGAEKWVKYEEERWLCSKCHKPMSWYDAQCAGCGEKRSEKLFRMTRNGTPLA